MQFFEEDKKMAADTVANTIKLKRSEEKFMKLFELSPVGMALIYYDNHEFIEVNDALTKCVGYSREELMKMTFWDITPEKFHDQELQQFNDLEATGRFGPNEKEYISKSGVVVPVRISGFVLEDVDGSKIVWGITEDITLEKENQKFMNRLAFYDTLTGLMNRRMMTMRFDQLQGISNVTGKPFGLFYIDLDDFKPINDTYGHNIGDLILIHVAKRIKHVIKRDMDVVARIGGDEFVVIISDIESQEVLLKLSDVLKDSIKVPYTCDAGTFEITVSIGTALYPRNGSSEKDLIRFADIEMYKMKNAKKL